MLDGFRRDGEAGLASLALALSFAAEIEDVPQAADGCYEDFAATHVFGPWFRGRRVYHAPVAP